MTPYEQFKAEGKAEIAALGEDERFRQLSRDWMDAANHARYSYHFEWLGRPIIQYPQDIVALSELIFAVKPDLVIETGIAHGGSLMLTASMLLLLDFMEGPSVGETVSFASKRRVMGIDIDIRAHNRQAIEAHPLSFMIELVQGSSIDQNVIARARTAAEGARKVMVVLDSNHTHDHVLEELRGYADLVSPGSYCVVFDTVIEDMPAEMFHDRPWGKGNSPKSAIWEFLTQTDSFEIDKEIENKLGPTVGPDGFLRRVR